MYKELLKHLKSILERNATVVKNVANCLISFLVFLSTKQFKLELTSTNFHVFIKCFTLLQTVKGIKFFILNRSFKSRESDKLTQHKRSRVEGSHTHVKNVVSFPLNECFLTSIEFILKRNTTIVKGMTMLFKAPHKEKRSSHTQQHPYNCEESSF